MACSTTASFLLKKGKSFSHILRNPPLVRPNAQAFQSLIKPTPQKLYVQRPICNDGFDVIAFVRGIPSFDFVRMEAARLKERPVSDEDESGDKYGLDDEEDIADEDVDFLSGDDYDFDEDDDDDGSDSS